MKQLSFVQMEVEVAGNPNAVSCVLGAASLVGGLVATALCPPAGVALGGLWVAGFLADVTNTTLACAQWAAGDK